MLFPNHFAYLSLKMLARISLRDVALARNKYLIVTSDAFLLPKTMRSSVLCLYDGHVLQLLWKKILRAMR